jgi:hypothetical protein
MSLTQSELDAIKKVRARIDDIDVQSWETADIRRLLSIIERLVHYKSGSISDIRLSYDWYRRNR